MIGWNLSINSWNKQYLLLKQLRSLGLPHCQRQKEEGKKNTKAKERNMCMHLFAVTEQIPHLIVSMS